jgi:CO dehydrogenase nickel-insertion accessory protein CooC1
VSGHGIRWQTIELFLVESVLAPVLSIVETSFDSLALAEKISYMAEGTGVGRIRAAEMKYWKREGMASNAV